VTSFVLEVWAYLRSQRANMLELATRPGRLVERGSRGPLSLRQGQEWERLLLLNIRECDVFYLFWSAAARRSE
jgi:hypothetical protein